MGHLPRLGLIGLGIMGRPMGRNLLRAGYPLVVHDINREAVAELVSEGAAAAPTSRDVAAGCDVLITMLPDSPDVEAVYAGPDGAFETLRPGWLAGVRGTAIGRSADWSEWVWIEASRLARGRSAARCWADLATCARGEAWHG